MIAEYRESKNMTQKELSVKSGVPLRALQDYEQGQRKLTKAAGITIYKLSKILGVSMENLIESEMKEEV